MKEDKIIEGNKLIAKFMGAVIIDKLSNVMFFPQGDATIIGKRYLHENDLKYHLSWDWLMMVIERIENTSIIGRIPVCVEYTEKGFGRFILNIHDDEFNFRNTQTGNVELKINSFWLATVEFIKWYNKFLDIQSAPVAQ